MIEIDYHNILDRFLNCRELFLITPWKHGNIAQLKMPFKLANGEFLVLELNQNSDSTVKVSDCGVGSNDLATGFWTLLLKEEKNQPIARFIEEKGINTCLNELYVILTPDSPPDALIEFALNVCTVSHCLKML